MKQVSLLDSTVVIADQVQEAMDNNSVSRFEARQMVRNTAKVQLSNALTPDVKDATDTQNAVNNLVESAMDAEATSVSVWMQTGEVIQLNNTEFADGQEKKDMSKSFTSILNKNAKIDDIPEFGISRSSGEEIELRKTNGKIKWSSWVVTARIVQNTSDIFKGIVELGYDVIFPNGEIISRPALLQLLKDAKPDTSETPAETIIRCLEMIGKKIADMDKKDIDAVEQRLIETNVTFADFKSAS